MAIKKCVCDHPFQDKKYGKKMRVANDTRGSIPGFRCTVCGKDVVSAPKKR